MYISGTLLIGMSIFEDRRAGLVVFLFLGRQSSKRNFLSFSLAVYGRCAMSKMDASSHKSVNDQQTFS